MPKIRELTQMPPMPEGDAEAQVDALRDYLLRITEELTYLLTHLEADNINDSTFERIQSMIPRPYTGLPVMDGDANPGQSEQWARGNHRHPPDTGKADVTALEAEAAAREAHEADTNNPHEVTKAQVGLGNVANERQYSAQNPPPIPTPGEVGAIPTTDKGTAGGVAELDSNGMVPSAQLPSYVDDVLEYASYSAFPATGESGKIYVARDTNRTYRWSGSAYVEISESLALGETSSTAYRGDRGKTAYDHSQVTSGNPHNVTATEVGLSNVANERQYSANNPPPEPDADEIDYDPSTSGLTATDVQSAIDETITSLLPNGYVPQTTLINNQPLSTDIYLTAASVGARPDSWYPHPYEIGAVPWSDVGAPTGVAALGDDGLVPASQLPPIPDSADEIDYDPTTSGLASTNVQDALDEVYGDIPAQASDIGAQEEITASGILKGDGAGGVSAAVAGTDYATPAQLAEKAKYTQYYISTVRTITHIFDKSSMYILMTERISTGSNPQSDEFGFGYCSITNAQTNRYHQIHAPTSDPVTITPGQGYLTITPSVSNTRITIIEFTDNV